MNWMTIAFIVLTLLSNDNLDNICIVRFCTLIFSLTNEEQQIENHTFNDDENDFEIYL